MMLTRGRCSGVLGGVVPAQHRNLINRPGFRLPRSASCPSNRRRVSEDPLNALPDLFSLSKLFDSSKQQQQSRNRYRRAAEQLLDLLLAGYEGSSSKNSRRQEADLSTRIDELLDVLLSCEGTPFNEQLLSGGPWLVLYSRGTPQLWRTTYKAGKVLNSSNTASQEFDTSNRTVVNKAQYAGPQLYVTASGTYQAVDDSKVLPKVLQANITSGLLHLFSVNIPLPIRGSGRFEVVYVDQRLRVFRSGGAVSVQVRQELVRGDGT